MIMEQFGYFLSEAPLLILIVWSSFKILRWRRSRENRPPYSERDRRMLFHAGPPCGPEDWHFYARFALAVVAVTVFGLLQIIALAPLGAAILAGTLVLTSAAVVHEIMLVKT